MLEIQTLRSKNFGLDGGADWKIEDSAYNSLLKGLRGEGRERELPMIRSALPRGGAIEGLGRGLGSGLLVLALALSCAACGGSLAVLTAFRTEQQAQEYCPEDTIVWLDPRVACIN